jgi:alpha-N-arabinofuranosidase
MPKKGSVRQELLELDVFSPTRYVKCMKPTTLTIHPAFSLGPVDPRIFGGFLEHLGRAVYEGVYDPASPLADENGFRRDVMAALRRLKMTAMRYPGGNFASGYHWMDGVGPVNTRPVVRELAWQSRETNQFGTEEFLRLCRVMDWTPMITVNLGTGTPEEARNWVEYCNCPAGTMYADKRVANGSPAPHGVKLWCLGNEMDGPWQLGHVPAHDYAIRALQATKMMKDADPTIEVVACGSCAATMPTYMSWDREVLEFLGERVDYISLHRYTGNRDGDTPDFLAVTNGIDQQIEEMAAACRFVQARNRSPRPVRLCFDEWNTWYKDMSMDGKGQAAPHLIEERYNLEDALVAAGFLNSFIRHADCLKIANLAQIVNVIAPILTDGDRMLIQSIFYPFEMMSKRREGVSLRVSVDGPTYKGKSNGVATFADASAILDGRRLHAFVTNRSMAEPAEIRIRVGDFAMASLAEAELLTGPDAKAENTFEFPNRVCSRPFDAVSFRNGHAVLTLPPLSFFAGTFNLDPT